MEPLSKRQQSREFSHIAEFNPPSLFVGRECDPRSFSREGIVASRVVPKAAIRVGAKSFDRAVAVDVPFFAQAKNVCDSRREDTNRIASKHSGYQVIDFPRDIESFRVYQPRSGKFTHAVTDPTSRLSQLADFDFTEKREGNASRGPSCTPK